MTDIRFWSKVSKTSGCWIWTGSIRPNGYGQVRRNGKNYKAHRWAYELENGPIPDGLHIDHLCRVKACARPSHLEAVSQQENNARTADPNFCRNGHPRIETYVRKDGTIECRVCYRIRNNRAYAAKVGKVSA